MRGCALGGPRARLECWKRRNPGPAQQRRCVTRDRTLDRSLATRTILDPDCREKLLHRFRHLRPEAPPRWGRMSASQMLVHLTDQMRHTLGDVSVAPRRGPMRWPIVKQAVLYWLPWPRGRVNGPPEAFVTHPTTWEADLMAFEKLIGRFVGQHERTQWPAHALFGAMSRRAWGIFCHRHFDHHLRQFGA